MNRTRHGNGFLLYGPDDQGNYDLRDPLRLLSKSEAASMAEELRTHASSLFRAHGERCLLKTKTRIAAGHPWLVQVHRPELNPRMPWVVLEPAMDADAVTDRALGESDASVATELAGALVDELGPRLGALTKASPTLSPGQTSHLTAAERAGLTHAWEVFRQRMSLIQRQGDPAYFFLEFLAARAHLLRNDPENGFFELASRAIQREWRRSAEG